MSGRYEYTNVPERWKEFAKRELNENPSQVNAHIESLAKWVRSMPHLNCPTDVNFLLTFLRVAKFDYAKAQMRLDNFCTIRSSPRGSPHLLKLFNVDDPIVERFLSMKFTIPLGFNEAGEFIILYRCCTWDSDTISVPDIHRLFFMVLNILLMDEAIQIYGIKLIFDLENLAGKNIFAMCDPRLISATYRILQDSYPIRVTNQIFYKEPFVFNVLFKIMTFFMNDELTRVTFRLSQDIQEAEKQIPGLIKILPKEYNGEGDTIDNIAEMWNQKFREFYKNDHLFANISVDESKRPPEGSNYLVDGPEYKDEVL